MGNNKRKNDFGFLSLCHAQIVYYCKGVSFPILQAKYPNLARSGQNNAYNKKDKE